MHAYACVHMLWNISLRDRKISLLVLLSEINRLVEFETVYCSDGPVPRWMLRNGSENRPSQDCSSSFSMATHGNFGIHIFFTEDFYRRCACWEPDALSSGCPHVVHHGRPCHKTFGNVFRHHCSVGDSLLLGLRDTNLILWRCGAFEFLFSWRWWDSQHQFQAILYLSKDSRSLLAQVKVGDYPGVEEQMVQSDVPQFRFLIPSFVTSCPFSGHENQAFCWHFVALWGLSSSWTSQNSVMAGGPQGGFP